MVDRRRRSDEGLSLVEVMVSLSIATLLLGSIGAFSVGAMASTWHQGRAQTATQLALDGMETARTLRGSGLIEGRAACTATCPTAVAAAAGYLVNTQRWDAASTPVVVPALPLPSTGEDNVIDGVTLKRYWYVARCWAPRGGGTCVDTAAHAPTAGNPVPLYLVVIAVTWEGRYCATTGCSYVSTELFAGETLDPVFRT
jgi:type II secretory pathway pseudopilin PulG